jgi:hypothetical protein
VTSRSRLLLLGGLLIAATVCVVERADHYSLLRSIQTIFGLDCLAQSCKAAAIPELLNP